MLDILRATFSAFFLDCCEFEEGLLVFAEASAMSPASAGNTAVLVLPTLDFVVCGGRRACDLLGFPLEA